MTYTPGQIVKTTAYTVGGWRLQGVVIIWDINPAERAGQHKVLVSLYSGEDIRDEGNHHEYLRGVLNSSGELYIQAGGEQMRVVHLGTPAGTYVPNDPAYNSIEIMRDAGRRRLDSLYGPDGDGPCTEESAGGALSRAKERIFGARRAVEQAETRRDVLIRRMLAGGVAAERLAELAGLSSRQRIYQIRDETR